jgi:CheY-like chemotaxis protein
MNEGSDRPKLKVLVVEDEAITALVESRLIDSFGYQSCGIASNGEDAVLSFSRELPSIVCMDIGLPGSLDGIEAAALMLEANRTCIIFITGYDDPERLRRAKSLDPVCLLIKPVSAEVLRRGLEAASLRIGPGKLGLR